MKQAIAFLLFIFTCFTSLPQSIQETRKLYSEGKYEEAKAGAEKLIKSSPSNASYNQWYGVCLFETGEYAASEKYLEFAASKKVINANLYLGKLYYMQYRFDESATAYEAYLTFLQEENDTEQESEIASLLAQSNRAARLLKHTEDIQIIDSIVVDKADFLNYYNISEESGSLVANEKEKQFIHTNQLQNKRYYAKSDTNDVSVLYTQNYLIDKWGDETQLPDVINSTQGNSYPFVMTDGITIYYASKGHESIGGYDLFISRYNTNTDSYLSPEQLGMPFNSTYNDYMLVIDEINDIGYFSTDRFQPEEKVIIYTFIPNEVKKRIENEDENTLRDRAMITSIRDSWRDGIDYAGLIQELNNNVNDVSLKEKKDFSFVINDNIIYHALTDFDSDAAKSVFIELQQLGKDIDKLENDLEKRRLEFSEVSSNTDSTLKKIILDYEQSQIEMKEKYKQLSIQVRNTEIRHLRQLQQ